MTIEAALKRLGWRLGTGKPFAANQLDVDAFNNIVEFVEEKQKRQLINNQLFGKLYIYLYGEFVTYYKTSVMDNIPQKELHKLLDKDLRLIVSEVTDRLNLSELENVIVDTNSLKGYSPLTYDEVADNLRVMVNGALNEFNTKK